MFQLYNVLFGGCHVTVCACHDDVIRWKYAPRCWPFVRGIHRSSVNSPHKGQWRALIFSLICVWINDWVNNRETGDLRRHRAHHDVTAIVRESIIMCTYYAQLWTDCHSHDMWSVLHMVFIHHWFCPHLFEILFHHIYHIILTPFAIYDLNKCHSNHICDYEWLCAQCAIHFVYHSVGVGEGRRLKTGLPI